MVEMCLTDGMMLIWYYALSCEQVSILTLRTATVTCAVSVSRRRKGRKKIFTPISRGCVRGISRGSFIRGFASS